MSDADRLRAVHNATRDQLWREAENLVGEIFRISLLGPQSPQDEHLIKGVMALVASELVHRAMEREKEEQS